MIYRRGCNVAEKGRREVADPEKRMVGTSVKYSEKLINKLYIIE